MLIGSLNVRGLRDKQKRSRLYNYVKERKYDIFLIQFIFTDKDKQEWQNEWKGLFYTIPHNNQSRGLIILIKNEDSYEYIKPLTFAYDDRVQAIVLKIKNVELKIFKIYMPPIMRM